MTNGQSAAIRPSSSKRRLLFLSPAQTQAMGGVLRFSKELARSLDPYVELRHDSVFPQRRDRSSTIAETHGAGELLLGTWSLRRRVRLLEAEGLIDVVFSSFHWPPRLTRDVPMIGFVHDLRFLGAHDHGRVSRRDLRAHAVFEAIASWDVCTAPSEHVADDVSFHLPWVHVEVIGEGVDHFPRVDCALRDRGVLIVSGSAAHKRPELGKALAVELAQEHGLSVRTLGLPAGSWADRAGVSVLDGLTDEELAAAMAQSGVVAFTTEYEGFGLAAGEAIWQGVGVVYDRRSHLGGLVGTAGLAVDGSVTSFVAGVRAALSRIEQLGIEATKSASQRTWDRVACQLASIVQPGAMVLSVDESPGSSGGPEAPFWSVVIPTHNRKALLSACIASVLNQTDGDFEVLIVDDGSTDGTADLVAAIVDPRIRYIELPENRGASAARNSAIRAASGAFLAFLDSDDRWLPTKLADCREVLQSAGTDLLENQILMHATRIDRLGTVTETILDDTADRRYLDRVLDGELLQTSSLVLSRALAIQALFAENLRVYEDWDFVVRNEAALDGKAVRILNRPLTIHRADQHVDRLSSSPHRRESGRIFLVRHSVNLTTQQRARFWVLRQLHDEAEAMSNLKLFQYAVSHAVRGRPLRKAHYTSLILILSRYRVRSLLGLKSVSSPRKAMARMRFSPSRCPLRLSKKR